MINAVFMGNRWGGWIRPVRRAPGALIDVSAAARVCLRRRAGRAWGILPRAALRLAPLAPAVAHAGMKVADLLTPLRGLAGADGLAATGAERQAVSSQIALYLAMMARCK